MDDDLLIILKLLRTTLLTKAKNEKDIEKRKYLAHWHNQVTIMITKIETSIK